MKGKLLLFLFALPFFGVGVWMGYSIGANLLDAWQMRSWIPVDAVLQDAGYHTHDGEDSQTYEAYAQYSYSYGGQPYRNDRVALSGGADNIGDYQRDLGRRLNAALISGGRITVYLDPEEPQESIVDPSLRWALLGFKAIFLFVFGGVGLGLIIWVFKAPGARDLAAAEYRDAPWLANDDWQSAEIRSSSKQSMWFAWGFATIWNLVSAPLPFLVYGELFDKHNVLALIGLLFPLIGLGLLVWAVRRTGEWRRFGPAPVTLDPFPGSIGGHVGGTIDVSLPYDPNARFSLTLTSLYSYESGSGKNRSRKESAKWQDTQQAHASAGPNGTRLSFRFDVPADLQPSDAAKDGEAYYLWRLNLKAELPGIDIDRDYEIPVYATGEQSRHLSGLSIESARAAQKAVDLEAIRELLRFGHGVRGKSLHYPVGRHLGSGFAGGVCGAIFAGAGWFLFVHEDAVLIGSAFGFVGLLILLLSLYLMLNSLEVVQDGSEIRTIRRVLGLPVRQKSMRRSEFVRFSKHSSMSTQTGGTHVMYYSVFAHDRAGQKLTIGEGFAGASQADAATDLVAREFGLNPQAAGQEPGQDFGSDNVLTADQ